MPLENIIETTWILRVTCSAVQLKKEAKWMLKKYTAQTKHLSIKKFSISPQDTVFCLTLSYFVCEGVRLLILTCQKHIILNLYFCNLWMKAMEKWRITMTASMKSTGWFKVIEIDLPW